MGLEMELASLPADNWVFWVASNGAATLGFRHPQIEFQSILTFWLHCMHQSVQDIESFSPSESLMGCVA